MATNDQIVRNVRHLARNIVHPLATYINILRFRYARRGIDEHPLTYEDLCQLETLVRAALETIDRIRDDDIERRE